MDLKKNQNSVYPGTWLEKKNPCTGVHESERKKNLMCSSGGGGGPVQKEKKKWQCFSKCEKVNQF